MHKKTSILSKVLGISMLTAAMQSFLQRDRGNVAMKKIERRKKKSSGGRGGRAKYRPGNLGPSAVSQAIKQDFGVVLSRKQRKYYAKAYGITFKAYYNGNEPVKGDHKIKPSKYSGKKRVRGGSARNTKNSDKPAPAINQRKWLLGRMLHWFNKLRNKLVRKDAVKVAA